MRKKLTTIVICLLILGSIGFVLANNKAKIDKAAQPVKEKVIVPVKTAEATEAEFNTSFSLTGSTVPAREVKLASEVQGKLTNLYIKNGDFISAGQLIATLDASVFNAQLMSLESSIAKAEMDITRYTKLLQMGGATPMQLESAVLQHNSLMAERKSILQQMAHMQIRAPFGGKVENVMVERGSFVSFGTVLADLLDNSSLKIRVFLSEQEAFRVKTEQQVNISSVVLSKPITGRVSMISDKADASGKFQTEIMFANKGKEYLKAGMLAEVSFVDEKPITALSIPMNAFAGSAKQGKVFVAIDGHVAERIIKTGISDGSKVQVLEGLKAGDRVITSGHLNLENGTPISIIK